MKRSLLDSFLHDTDDDLIEVLEELDSVFNDLPDDSKDRVFKNLKQTLVSNFNFTLEELDDLWVIANTCDRCGLKFKCSCMP